MTVQLTNSYNAIVGSKLFIQTTIVLPIDQISQWKKSKSLIKIVTNFSVEDGLNNAIPCELSNANGVMVAIKAEPEQINKVKVKTKCSIDMTKRESIW